MGLVSLLIVNIDGKIYKLFDDGFIIANIQIKNDKSINFITGHSPAFQIFGKKPEEYGYVYKLLENEAKKCINPDIKTFIVGDYNTEELFKMLPYLKNNFKNNIDGATYFEGTSIDYILSERDIKCLSNEKVKNLSDHFLCIADFQINWGEAMIKAIFIDIDGTLSDSDKNTSWI